MLISRDTFKSRKYKTSDGSVVTTVYVSVESCVGVTYLVLGFERPVKRTGSPQNDEGGG